MSILRGINSFVYIRERLQRAENNSMVRLKNFNRSSSETDLLRPDETNDTFAIVFHSALPILHQRPPSFTPTTLRENIYTRGARTASGKSLEKNTSSLQPTFVTSESVASEEISKAANFTSRSPFLERYKILKVFQPLRDLSVLIVIPSHLVILRPVNCLVKRKRALKFHVVHVAYDLRAWINL